jgi:hypothetical protein
MGSRFCAVTTKSHYHGTTRPGCNFKMLATETSPRAERGCKDDRKVVVFQSASSTISFPIYNSERQLPEYPIPPAQSSIPIPYVLRTIPNLYRV